MMIRRYIFIIVSLVCMLGAIDVIGQGFKAAGIGGINISQIDGDGDAGYNKWGFTAGGRAVYEFPGKSDLGFEFLYSQRGSRRSGPLLPFSIQLHYVELPLVYSFNDWYIEGESYFKVRVDAGFSYGFLFNTKYVADGIIGELDDLSSHDFSYLLGLGYQFTKKWGMSLRYTSSINKMLKDDKLEYGGLRGHFLTLRLEYYF